MLLPSGENAKLKDASLFEWTPVALAVTSVGAPRYFVLLKSLSTGALFTAVASTSIVMVAAADVSWPPLAVPPSSCTSKLNEAKLLPAVCTDGGLTCVNTSAPDAICAAEIG